MTDDVQALIPQHTGRSAPLTRGLARNTVFNLIGWAWPALLAFASVPYIVSGLGNEAFGVFSIVSIVAGYLGLLNEPIAMGNVRFMAEAYGRQDWREFRDTAVTGVVVNAALAALGAAVMFIAAGALASGVFRIPASSVASATVAFRIGAASFFLKGIVGSLKSVPTAMRRYDILNVVNLAVGSLNMVGIVLAIWLGLGLCGAVTAQLLSNSLAVICFAAVASMALRKLPVSGRTLGVDRHIIKRLVSFSSLLFLMRVVSTIGLQVDRTLVGMLLGASAVTFYTVPAEIANRIPGFMASFATTLYPLSAESVATGRLDELRRLYLNVERLLLWVSSFFAVVLIALSHDILALWIGPEMAAKSQWVLVFLAGAAMCRAPGSMAYQVTTGVGRADVPLWAGLISVVVMTLTTLVLVKPFGIIGVAFGVFIAMIPLSVGFDLFTQRRILQQRNWRVSLALYARPALSVIATLGCVELVRASLADLAVEWWILLLKGILVAIVYLMFSVLFGALSLQDIRRWAARFYVRFTSGLPGMRKKHSVCEREEVR